MGRKRGFDEKKIASIIRVLYQNPDGIWLRKIAEITKLSPATVSKYLDGVLNPLIEDVSLTGKGRRILRVVKLKPPVLEKLREGRNIQQILKLLRLMESVRE